MKNSQQSNNRLKSKITTPSILIKSSMFVLASVLVACSSNVETSESKKQKMDSDGSAHVVELKNEKELNDLRLEEAFVSAESREKDLHTKARDRRRITEAQKLIKPSGGADMAVPSIGYNVTSSPVVMASVPVNKRPHTSNPQGAVYMDTALTRRHAAKQLQQNPDPYLVQGNEKYADVGESEIKRVSKEPVSTFSIDVDTGSYTNVRRMLNANNLPPANAVRVEEFINYFDYNYEAPRNKKEPFAVSSELSQTPWNTDSMLLKIGLKAYEVDANERPAANLVFLMDVSGSMNNANKLPLLKQSFEMLTEHLTENDSVSIVVYAGASGVVLNPTSGDDKHSILEALQRLRAGGSTNGVAGIHLAYQMAEEAFVEGGINRIILATDGDFNVGTSGTDELKRLVEDKRKTGISLTTLGFGAGNYNDHLMEQIADVGNGNNAYIDSVREAEKVLVTEMNSTLLTVAKDVKIQVEFNPAQVSEYRLIGYENRALAREDFNNDKVDAGEIGAGHTVTAIYEVFPVDSKSVNIDPLRYGKKMLRASENKEIGHVKLRYKYPDAEVSTLRSFVVNTNDKKKFSDMSRDFKFATAVSAFGQKLKRSKYLGDFSFTEIADLAEDNSGRDKHGYRNEFVSLVDKAAHLMGDAPEHLMSESN